MGLFRWLRRGKDKTTTVEMFATTEAGRRHLVGVPYTLPKDDQEISRLDFQHYMLRYTLRGDYAAPIQQPRRILDVGCGTGRWPREMAQIFPDAEVFGIDIADADPKTEPPPPNYHFQIANVFEGLPFPDGSFDFTHARLLSAAVPCARWPQVVSEMMRVTCPGGWIESLEAMPLRDGGPGIAQLNDGMFQMCEARGIDANYGVHVQELFRASGLTNMLSREILIPMGKYGGRIGTMMATDWLAIFTGLRGPVTATTSMSADAYDQALASAREYVNTDRCRCVAPFILCYGQKN